MSAQGPIADLITTYHELNATIIDEFHEEPSALEFMRYVAKNRPFVVRSGAKSWKAYKEWNAEYLAKVMKDKDVQVAVTPYGNADGVVETEDGTLLAVEPHQMQENFLDFMHYVQADSSIPPPSPPEIRNVKYGQTQNDNLRSEYSTLFADVPQDIPWARIALQQPPDAINFWLGNARSVTAMHKDNYENVYVQIRGQKHFVLLPPIEMPCANEQFLTQHHYTPVSAQDSETLQVKPQINPEPIPVAIWDPEVPSERTSEYSHLSKPLSLTLNEGDMLYLPAMWYHKVKQSSGEEGFACAVNYWYDMSFEGAFWAQNSFVRDVVLEGRRRVGYPNLEIGEKNKEVI
ncbi:hypothetical protein ASPWEDRAFT_184203 [Aspergillus wentii DTO 134E9]|uniref:JmjC domain-containing protein n=1 Tax=Aspergillus wentii DTO 134E9 TaxID=1073089 RepID=A0A1L9RN60_ASPWE|nr:uncharacterized protein ASPWEDRAFT_184203 [Aspergillus wentii DTO 134E9]KAI9929294.1 hypothetical protein MW887_000761 [Aspergillus wentii]OJJ36267.1 hypothetical protein ASPWEDRAFT_184203 [Aspergillus wentii DTO 134E9]